MQNKEQTLWAGIFVLIFQRREYASDGVLTLHETPLPLSNVK
jgi:hypothetical protein